MKKKLLLGFFAFFAISASAVNYVFDNGKLSGDINDDGQVNSGDISELYTAIIAGSTAKNFDINGDDQVNAGDVSALYDIIVGGKTIYSGGSTVTMSDYVLCTTPDATPAEHQWKDGDIIYLCVNSTIDNCYKIIYNQGKWTLTDFENYNGNGFLNNGGFFTALWVDGATNATRTNIPVSGDYATGSGYYSVTIDGNDLKVKMTVNLTRPQSMVACFGAKEGDKLLNVKHVTRISKLYPLEVQTADEAPISILDSSGGYAYATFNNADGSCPFTYLTADGATYTYSQAYELKPGQSTILFTPHMIPSIWSHNVSVRYDDVDGVQQILSDADINLRVGEEIYLTWYDGENLVSSINGSNLHTTLSDENVVKETWASIRKAVSGITLTAQSEGTSTMSLTATIHGEEKTYQFKINVKPSVWVGGYYTENGNTRPALWRNGKLFKVFNDFTGDSVGTKPYVSKIQFYKDKIYVMLQGSNKRDRADLMEGNVFSGVFTTYDTNLRSEWTHDAEYVFDGLQIAYPLLSVSASGDVYYTNAIRQNPDDEESKINISFWKNKEPIAIELNRVARDMIYIDEQALLAVAESRSDFRQNNLNSRSTTAYIVAWGASTGMQSVTTIDHSWVNYLSYNNHQLVASGQYWYNDGTGAYRYSLWTIANKSYNTISAGLGDARAFSRGDTYVTGRYLLRADGTTFDYFNETNRSIYGVNVPQYSHGLGTAFGDYGYYVTTTIPEEGSGRAVNVIVIYNLDQPMYEPEYIYFPKDVYNYGRLETIEVQSSIL